LFCAAVAEQALTSKQRGVATANHSVARTSQVPAKPEVTSAALLGDGKQRGVGAGALQQLSVDDFRVTSTNTGRPINATGKPA